MLRSLFCVPNVVYLYELQVGTIMHFPWTQSILYWGKKGYILMIFMTRSFKIVELLMKHAKLEKTSPTVPFFEAFARN